MHPVAEQREALEGRVVLVTGAARRIGRSIALRLARCGARVAIHYNASREEAEQTARECGDAPTFAANLSNVADVQAMVDDVQAHFGRLDALVANAARFTRLDPLAITEADWDFIHDVNLKATFFAAQRAAHHMLRQDTGGRIVTLSSLGALRPWADHAHYCASKAGVVMLTRSLAKAWAPTLSVNTVAPGFIPFDEPPDARRRGLVADTPFQRVGEGWEVADAVLYFLEAPKFITGQLLAVDGGLSLR